MVMVQHIGTACSGRNDKAYEDPDDAGFELDRVAICGCLDGDWFTAIMRVDGEGNAPGMTGCRIARDRTEARDAMLHGH